MATIGNPIVVGGGASVTEWHSSTWDYTGYTDLTRSYTFTRDYSEVYVWIACGFRGTSGLNMNLNYSGSGTKTDVFKLKTNAYWDAYQNYMQFKITNVKKNDKVSLSFDQAYSCAWSVIAIE